jgi:hypothetical protein
MIGVMAKLRVNESTGHSTHVAKWLNFKILNKMNPGKKLIITVEIGRRMYSSIFPPKISISKRRG